MNRAYKYKLYSAISEGISIIFWNLPKSKRVTLFQSNIDKIKDIDLFVYNLELDYNMILQTKRDRVGYFSCDCFKEIFGGDHCTLKHFVDIYKQETSAFLPSDYIPLKMNIERKCNFLFKSPSVQQYTKEQDDSLNRLLDNPNYLPSLFNGFCR